jgi:hypothetical protein
LVGRATVSVAGSSKGSVVGFGALDINSRPGYLNRCGLHSPNVSGDIVARAGT